MTEDRPAEPAFVQFAPPIRAQSRLRRAITAAFRRPEPVCLAALIDEASLPDDLRARISATARDLVLKIRAKGQRGSVEGLMKEYALSSDEGVALMCMAEALLRIPDNDTRDALIPGAATRLDPPAMERRIAELAPSGSGSSVGSVWESGGVEGRYDLYLDSPDGSSMVRVDGPRRWCWKSAARTGLWRNAG